MFAYDYLGRRIRKQVFDWDDQAADWQATPSVQRKFVWGGTDAGGWLLLMELDGSDNVVRKYTWGLDLAGQHGSVNSLESAGGIGGLLAVAQAQVGGGSAAGGVDAGDYVFTYDANGNVAQVLDLSAGSAAAAIAAHYEYDPYGGVVNDLSGYTYAEANPIRFSTKYHDAETGLGYWGYRYYSARLGRWISPDPLEEDGGLNLYVYALNSAIQAVDPLGQKARVSVDPQSCTITVTLNIGIYGAAASSALASTIQRCINSHWNGHTTRKGCGECDPGNCKVTVEAHVKYYPDAKHWFHVPEDNQIKIRGSTGKRSWVSWPGASWGHWEDDTPTRPNPDPCWVFAHEAGHLMGLPDRYSYWTGKPKKGHEGHIMGRYGMPVTQRQIDGILAGKKCPEECCCPPTSKPTTR